MQTGLVLSVLSDIGEELGAAMRAQAMAVAQEDVDAFLQESPRLDPQQNLSL